MTYKHGVTVSEIPTAVTPPVQSSTVPVVFGSAPVNLSKRGTAPVNEPVLCKTFQEAVDAFGYSDDWSFSLCEFMYSHFALFAVAPVVFVNVLDPANADHKTSVADVPASLVNDVAKVTQQGILIDSVVVKNSGGTTTYVLDTDYTLGFDERGNLTIQRIAGGAIGSGETLSVDFDKLKPAGVTENQIIGGMDVNGNATGLELINQVFPRFRQVPGMIVAPGFSHIPNVADVMTAKAGSINGLFKTTALTDIPASENYLDVPEWKSTNDYTSERQFNCYPKVVNGDKVFHLSTQLAGVLCATDAQNDNVPYISPSNQPMKITGAVKEDGTPLYLGPEQAQTLNGEGIVTALNFIGGWRAWGNRTGAYPSNTDPKDSFIPVRRMMDWIQNTIILTFWERVDGPITPRLVEAVTDSLNLWLNGLAAQGYILGGRVEFNQSDNPLENLMDGIIKFHVYVTPPSPAREIAFVVEYDAEYLNGLFG